MDKKQAKIRNIIDKAVQNLLKNIDSGKSEKLREYLSALAKFHNYSWANMLLISAQCPEATHVAGFGTWKKMGRFVKKGAKGIAIFAPVLSKKIRMEQEEKEENKVLAFRTVYVFDISQTGGNPMPESAKVSGDPSGYLTRLKQHISNCGIILEYSKRIGTAEWISCGGKILIKEGLSKAEEFSTLVHEYAHEKLHRCTMVSKANKKIIETEAEAVAFVVSQAIGLDTNYASSDYIQLYQGTKETLLEALQNIHRTAAEIIAGITT